MIRQVITGVVVLVSALAPIQASAECAWVLWPKRLDGDFVQNLLVYDTRQECESSKKDFIKGWDPKEEEQWPVTVRQAHPSHWRCLPDTIDPRGPKAGAQ